MAYKAFVKALSGHFACVIVRHYGVVQVYELGLCLVGRGPDLSSGSSLYLSAAKWSHIVIMYCLHTITCSYTHAD